MSGAKGGGTSTPRELGRRGATGEESDEYDNGLPMDFDGGDSYSRESCSVKSMTKMAHQTPSRTRFAVDYDQTPGLSRLTPGRMNRKVVTWYIVTVGHKPGIYTNESVVRHKVSGYSDGTGNHTARVTK